MGHVLNVPAGKHFKFTRPTRFRQQRRLKESPMSVIRGFFLSLTAIFLVVSSGCGGARPTSGEVDTDLAQVQLQQIGHAYATAITKLKHGPKDLEQLKPFLLEEKGGDALVGAIDRNEFVVIWDLDFKDLLPQTKPSEKPVVPVLAYATTKEEGRRYVLTGTTRIEDFTEEEFAKANFPKGHKPKP
jgi:hypothetical protein